MLKSFDGAHGQPDGAALHPWRDCTLVAVSSQTHPKNAPVRPSWPDFITVGHRWPRPLKPHASRAMHARRVASRVRLGSQRWPFSASRAWCTALHLLALDLHALAPFAMARWSRPDDLQPRGCGPAREQVVLFPHIPAFFALCTPESLLQLPTSNMTILPAKQATCDLCGLHGSGCRDCHWRTGALLCSKRPGGGGGKLTCRYIYLCVSICVYTRIIKYEMTYICIHSNSWQLF